MPFDPPGCRPNLDFWILQIDLGGCPVRCEG